ncbi:ribosome-binding factor A [Acetobacter sp. CAG:977]|nr:ribosome-binding factor A [Acetobacter sp. CAG:977]
MRSNSKPPSQRQLRVGEQIRHIFAEAFQTGNIPKELSDIPSVSVMEARVSPDFSYCKVFVLPLGGDHETALILAKALNQARGFFRTILAKQMRLRVAPEVRFFADESEHEAGKIEALLSSDRVRRDLAVVRDDEKDASE